MPLVETDAIVLHAFDYLESSRIVRLATRDAGVLSVIARGARQSRNRFGGALDLFTRGVARYTARPGRDLNTLSGFEAIHSRFQLATHLSRFAAAAALAELALRFSQADPHDGTFDVLDHALDALASAQPADVPAVGIASAWRFVATLGFAPAMDRCAICHVDLPDDAEAAFSHAAGGCVCDRCSRTAPVSRSLPAAARRAIAAWTSGGDASPGDDRARRAHVRLLREFLHHHVSDGRTLVAFDAWESGLAAPR